MKTKIYLFALFIFCITKSEAQNAKLNYQWRFGHNNGVSFSSGSPVSVSGSMTNENEGSSTISDSLGNLLFYCDDKNAFDRTNTIMPSGAYFSNSNCTQGVLIIPSPGNAQKYYICAVVDWVWPYGFNYYVVDMSLRGGLGDLVGPQVFLDSSSREQMAATWHANGKDMWVLTHEKGNNNFKAWLVTSSGISTSPVISSVGMTYSGSLCYGSLRLSHYCNKVVSTLGANSPETVQLLDFNNATGIVSNPVTLGTSSTIPTAYSSEFSPDDSKLYVTSYNGNYVYQYDLSNANPLSTQTNIASTTAGTKSSVLLGPDGKIYVNISSTNHLDVINSPNSLGLACNYSTNAVTLSGTCGLGLPNFLSTSLPCNPPALPVGSFAPSDTTFCGEGQRCIDFYDRSSGNPTSWQWLFPGAFPNSSTQQNPTNICYNQNGVYDVTLIVTNAAGTDTITISPMVKFSAGPPPPTISLQGDTLVCSTAFHYQWFINAAPIAAATDSFYVAHLPGTYAVQITDSLGCISVSNGILITSVKELTDGKEIAIYPNPLKSSSTLQLNTQLKNAEVAIYDMLGKELVRKKFTGDRMEIERGSLVSGVYFVRVRSEEREWVGKIVVE